MTRRLVLRGCLILGGALLIGERWIAATAPESTPSRIVSTSPSITETLFALGLGSRVVGVSTYCRFPPEVAALPKVGTFLKPDAELIARLRPDLVVLSAKPTDLDRRLTTLHIPFVVVDRGTLASVFTSIQQVGAAAGVPARADMLVADLQQRLARIRERYALQPRPSVMLIVGRRPGTLSDIVAVGRDSYLNDLIEMAGGANVFGTTTSPAYPRISLETVIRLNPDVIIDTVNMGETDAERSRNRPANEALWRQYPAINAVQKGHVYSVTTDAVVVPGPRVVEATEWLATLIHSGGAR
jgi:iron complex transport system substrate-binding protein